MTPMTSERLAEIKANQRHASPHIKLREMWKTNDELIAEVERLTAELATRREDGERKLLYKQLEASEEQFRYFVAKLDKLRAAVLEELSRPSANMLAVVSERLAQAVRESQ